MDGTFRFGADGQGNLDVVLEDGERILCRGSRRGADGKWNPVLAVLSAAPHTSPRSLDRLAHEFELKDDLDGGCALRPLELVRDGGRTVLLLEDPGGEPLEGVLSGPMEIGSFLRLAIAIAKALGQVHQRGLIHKDIQPAHIFVNCPDGEVRLTGFGLASRLARRRQVEAPPEEIAGTLSYMAPEQTGRMNRPVDTRSDLYSLGITLYRMLTSTLPFAASDPGEWVHCHLARRPLPPAERLAGIPEQVSAIVMRLLAKTPEERYETAAGLEADLRRCLVDWETRGRIDLFPLGSRDQPGRLVIPERLYGREREMETLLAAFDRAAASGGPELVLVRGKAGVGKSALVRDLERALAARHGMLASGKFDQYQRDIPYASLAQALRELMQPLLGKTEAELAPWRTALSVALGPNGGLMVSLVPDLELVVGPQPSVPELPPQDRQRRFQLVFRRLLGVFARPEHPLALFLDDLQWLDAATLDVLEDLLVRPDLPCLLLIGACRDDEVLAAHPLTRRLAAIRKAGGRALEMVLGPLRPEDVGRMVANVLQADDAQPLARLVHAKTDGNPFFAVQFLTALAEEGQLTFEHGAARWAWDLEQIRAKGFTDNVVELMVGKLRRLPAATRAVLKRLACLGNSAPVATLSLAHGVSEEMVHTAIGAAVRGGLVLRQAENYRFLHDRVQEATYALVPEGRRAAAHLAIGRRLLAGASQKAVEDNVFQIVGQLNRGAPLVVAGEERERLAELNLLAARRAKSSTAYASALTHAAAAAALLPEDAWERRRELAFAVELHRAECEFLTGRLGEAEARLSELAAGAASLPELATITRLRVDLFMTQGRSDGAVAVGLEYLRRVGIAWPAHPTRAKVREEYARLWRQLGDRPIEALRDLPRMADPVSCATMDVLTSLVTPALFTDENLRSLVIGRMGNLSLEHGNSDASCYAYATVGTVLGLQFGNYEAGFRFGQLGLDLVEQSGMDRLRARVYLAFGNLSKPSPRHFRPDQAPARYAFDAAQRIGDLTYAAISRNNLLTRLIATGHPLAEVQREAEAGLDFARQARFGLVADLITAQLQFTRTLRGLTPDFSRLDDDSFDEERFERHLRADPRPSIAACLYWIRKLQALVLAGDHAAAVAAAGEAERLLWMSPFIFERADYHFYLALALAARCSAAPAAEQAHHRKSLTLHHRRLLEWAQHCPENFAARAALVGAEIARVRGRELEAERLFEQAITSARDNGRVHDEAIACELAAGFYEARSLQRVARAYLQDARDCYCRWGADAKVRWLDASHPHLREDRPDGGAMTTIGAPVEHLDLATVIKVSQAIASEIVLEKLVETLLRTALEQAGAERGLLIMSRGAEQRITAEATTVGNAVAVTLRDEPAAAAALPESILQYVARTRESVILDDASARGSFADDPYIRQRLARSILCLPLVKQGQLTGILYLENNLAPRVFAPTRLAVLKLLASQAAVALENTRLYQDLAEREARIRRLIDANIIGIFLWDEDGRILEANDAFLRIVGYDRADLLAGGIRWTDVTQQIEDDRKAAVRRPIEKEYFRRDGSRVPVLVGSVSFEKGANQGVAFVLDLTELKQAEAALQTAQAQLAYANRIATMGQLTASIAHEVNQPIAASVINAHAAARALDARPLNLEVAREALDSIIKAGTRAGDVIHGIRALVKKAPFKKERLQINEAVLEVIDLTRNEAVKTAVSVQTRLAAELPLIQGDRVQLQQVILNLMLNAIEAMSAAGIEARELLVSTGKSEQGGILLAVRDCGPGLDAASMDRLFDAFFTTKPGGMGMGLSICRSIIEAHEGRLWAEPNTPRGAVFAFELPSSEQDAQRQAEGDGGR